MFKILALFFCLLSFNSFGNVYEDLKSPLTTDAKYPLIIGSLITSGTFLFKQDSVKKPQKYFSKETPLGSASRYGDWWGQLIPNAAYSLGMFSYSLLNDDPVSLNHAEGMLKATLYACLVTTGIKYTTQHRRPNKGHRNSFPSGHTTSAFAFASYVGAEHGKKWGIPAYLMASFVGISRLNDNMHWVSDVLAGATIGTAYGLGISFLNKKKYFKDISVDANFSNSQQSVAFSFLF